MALIQCPQCGQQISDRANKCPHCGYVINPSDCKTSDIKPTKSKKSIWFWCVGILILIGVGVSVFLYGTPRKDETVDSEQPVIAQQSDEVKITPEFSEKVSKYLKVGAFSDGRAAVMTDEYKWGYIDANGDLVIPAIYTAYPFGHKFSEGLALVETEQKKAYIDIDGKEVITLSKDDIASDFVDGRAVVYSAHLNDDWTFTLSDKFRVYNTQGEITSEVPLPNEHALIQSGEGEDEAVSVGLTDKGIIIPISNGKNRLYDFQGIYLEEIETEINNVVDPSTYDYIVYEETNDNGTYFTLKGIKDKQGNIIVPAKEWYFPNAIFDSKSNKTYINPSQGLFVAILEESPEYLKNIENNRRGDDSAEASYYGYVNLKGENTFSEERWERQRIQTYNRLNNITLHLEDY